MTLNATPAMRGRYSTRFNQSNRVPSVQSPARKPGTSSTGLRSPDGTSTPRNPGSRISLSDSMEIRPSSHMGGTGSQRPKRRSCGGAGAAALIRARPGLCGVSEAVAKVWCRAVLRHEVVERVAILYLVMVFLPIYRGGGDDHQIRIPEAS